MSELISRPRFLVALVVASAAAVVVLANAHLVYVAFLSQPDCVGHMKDASHQPGTYRAANSSC
ncbi:hypothetical protein CU102_26190 [Phyllobacterium brassicacearum]|uniref:Uncharacterized protein n=1 Tax=Phyllobacterium brassicacearum TaxID=314235 RepID=A0A2P7B692_9HYPH|nr:hypothetical protein [Phyllobacterium brassicacearum]PSH61981.1 hypothetical protein CU102_26190 [Phyllobacterium brassicacearum]TDQ14882.1 hypothetical protein DEV91_1359 [Phyllobacterium brassicacearum]